MKGSKEDIKCSSLYIKRTEKFIRERIKFYNLNLTDLVVYTEVGSGNYAFTPIIALLANTKEVYAIGKDSHFGSFTDIQSYLNRIISMVNVNHGRIKVISGKRPEHLKKADIVTNSGFVRPIDRKTLANMKPTAVIPLMWETWEFRKEEINLEYARKKGILVLGTNESALGKNILNYRGFLVAKLFFDCGMGLHEDKVLLIGSGRLGAHIAHFFRVTGVNFQWLTFDSDVDNKLRKYLIEAKDVNGILPNIDAIVIAEHFHKIELIGRKGIIKVEQLTKQNPLIQIIHICGNVNLDDINEFKLIVYPKIVKPFGFMTVTGDYIGPKVTLELNITGLKVGEIMARNRLKYDLKRAYEESIKNPLIDDFPGGYLNHEN